MRTKTLVPLLALGLLLALAPSAAAFTVSIDGYDTVWVPYGGCTLATWTASGTLTIDSYDWTRNSTRVSTTSSYSEEFCNPNLGVSTSQHFTLGLYATSNGYGDHDSLYITVIFEAGTPNGGGCGFVKAC